MISKHILLGSVRLLIMIFVICHVVPPGTSGSQNDDTMDIGFKMEVAVVIVQVTATVLDHKGLTVYGLEQDDFEIFEDGFPQKIIDFENACGLPKRILILLDVSGSMQIMNKIGAAKTTLEIFFKRLRKEDEIGLLFFADGELEVACDYTKDRELVFNKLRDVAAYGKTALRDAIQNAPRYAKADDKFQRALLLVTDGVDNASKVTLEEAINSARCVDLPVYSLGIDPLAPGDDDPDKRQMEAMESLRTLSEESGGRFFCVREVNDFLIAYDRLIRDLENQYLLTFMSKSGSKRGNHSIEVKSRKWRCKVRARKGYFVAE